MGARSNSTHEGKKHKEFIVKRIGEYYETVKIELIF